MLTIRIESLGIVSMNRSTIGGIHPSMRMIGGISFSNDATSGRKKGKSEARVAHSSAAPDKSRDSVEDQFGLWSL